MPELTRSDLVHRVIVDDGRWIAIHGSPGMGRSTLLGQVADELLTTGEWFAAVLNATQLRAALRTIKYRRARDIRPVLRWIGMQTVHNDRGVATLLIDDFDSTLTEEHRTLVAELLLGQPALRVVTVSIDPPAYNTGFTQRGLPEPTYIGAEELVLSRAMIEALSATVAESRPGNEALRTPVVIGRLCDVTRGVPVAVARALDRLTWSTDHPEHQFAQVMHQFIIEAMRARMRSSDAHSLSAMCNTFSLMPRFSFLHIAACFPNAHAGSIDALAHLTSLDGRRRVRAGDYAWSAEFLFAAKEINGPRTLERRSLAAEFYRSNLAGEAFEQWVLAGDLARAEAMLRTRFLTVYETLSPETAVDVCTIPPSELAAFPMIRVMQTLIEPGTTVRDLRQCAEWLGSFGARGGVTGILALAVRAAVRVRTGAIRLAYEQAEEVLREVEDHMFDPSTATEAEQRTFAEAALVAVLVLFEIGTIPSRLSTLPRGHGSPYLRDRREKAQQLLDHLRAEAVVRHSLLNSAVPQGYRALVFSGVVCAQEVAAIVAHDRSYADAHESRTDAAPAVPATLVPVVSPVRYFAPITECMRLLGLQDQAGAVDVAHRSDINEPHASVLQAVVLLATGRARDARETLDRLGDSWDARVEAARAMLRASALLMLGHREPARAELSRAHALPRTVVVQAIGLLSWERAEALRELHPAIGPAIDSAEASGLLRSETKHAQQRFQPLTEKERDVLRGLRDGLNTREIAERDFLSVNTVRTHVRSIGKKLDASGQAEMLRRASELRIFRDE